VTPPSQLSTGWIKPTAIIEMRFPPYSPDTAASCAERIEIGAMATTEDLLAGTLPVPTDEKTLAHGLLRIIVAGPRATGDDVMKRGVTTPAVAYSKTSTP
jgi:hypothetical protein